MVHPRLETVLIQQNQRQSGQDKYHVTCPSDLNERYRIAAAKNPQGSHDGINQQRSNNKTAEHTVNKPRHVGQKTEERDRWKIRRSEPESQSDRDQCER
jgi:hypothetical protein